MTKNAATHKGTCQLCGALQMLPSGRLAKHGYTTKWGFFSGTCAGSGFLPFEQSTDQIEAGIASVKKTIKSVAADIAAIEDLSNPVNDGTNVWLSIYIEGTYYSAGGYRWMHVKLHDLTTDSTTYGHPLSKCSYTTLEPVQSRKGSAIRTGQIEAYEEQWKMHTLPEWARFLNRKYAAKLAKDNAGRAEWIKWQQKRVATWAPAPLIPR